jgi:hypothetical protein
VRQADWIDRRLRETTNLGESAALVANDIAANMPRDPDEMPIFIVETGGGSLLGVYSNYPTPLAVIHIDHDDAELNSGEGAWRFEAKPLSALDKECKAVMFDAGITVRQT